MIIHYYIYLSNHRLYYLFVLVRIYLMSFLIHNYDLAAYVNGKRQGVVREKPFYEGQSIAEELAIASETHQSFPLPRLDVHSEIKLATQMAKSLPEDDVDHEMKELGLVR